jgi:hypothetical protein
MRYNRKKHFLLLELQKKNQTTRKNYSKDANLHGFTFEKIQSLLKLNKNELEILLSELLNSKEVHLFDINKEKGCIIDDEFGFLAISSKKYIKRNENIIINWFKVFTQIIIPIASLFIAFLALTLKFNSITDKIEKKVDTKYKQELKQIESKLDSILLLNSNNN